MISGYIRNIETRISKDSRAADIIIDGTFGPKSGVFTSLPKTFLLHDSEVILALDYAKGFYPFKVIVKRTDEKVAEKIIQGKDILEILEKIQLELEEIYKDVIT